MTKTELKQSIKEALNEVLESNPEILEQAMLKTMEDIAFIKAINEGKKGDYIEFEKFMIDLNNRVNESQDNYGNKD